MQRSRDLAAAQERERIANEHAQLQSKQQQQAQQQAAQLQALAEAQTAAGNRQAAQQARKAQREAEARAQAAAQNAQRQRRLAEQERAAQLNAQQQMRSFVASTQANKHFEPAPPSNSNGSTHTANRGSSESQASGLKPTPEAIMVCTRPSGENAKFECWSPTTRTYGSLKDIKGSRTPEERVMTSAACPSPRRLVSTTHLVWGCGFGATNNGNSMDRSAGVDVKGRNTYYCYERETGCRRTQP